MYDIEYYYKYFDKDKELTDSMFGKSSSDKDYSFKKAITILNGRLTEIDKDIQYTDVLGQQLLRS